MDVLFSPPSSDTDPLLMARPTHHVIDITPNSQASTSSPSPHGSRLVVSSSSGPSNGSSSSSRMRVRHGEGEQRTIRSPFNSAFWISVEAAFTLSQIIASVVVLALSRDEHTRAPLFAWIVGYASGCVATLPLLLWRFCYNNRVRELDSSQASPRIHDTSGTLLPNSRTNGGEDDWVVAATASPRRNRASWLMNPRLKLLMDYFKISVDCFFAIWFVVGNVWIFGGHSSASEAPNMYRLCVVFLTLSCICYAMPFILCATICCCLPCLVSVLGIREVLTETHGATSETIDTLPTYKFKMKKNKSTDESNSAVSEGGIVAEGTEKERMISREDAVCCICLAMYENNDELRELPCSHFFHKDCVDKWLKINATCPLCKSEIGENITGSVSGEHATQQ